MKAKKSNNMVIDTVKGFKKHTELSQFGVKSRNTAVTQNIKRASRAYANRII